jgi:hypothetical protein
LLLEYCTPKACLAMHASSSLIGHVTQHDACVCQPLLDTSFVCSPCVFLLALSAIRALICAC